MVTALDALRQARRRATAILLLDTLNDFLEENDDLLTEDETDVIDGVLSIVEQVRDGKRT